MNYNYNAHNMEVEPINNIKMVCLAINTNANFKRLGIKTEVAKRSQAGPNWPNLNNVDPVVVALFGFDCRYRNSSFLSHVV